MATVDFYRKQTKFAKVMFLQVSVCPGGMLGKGGMHGRGVCVAGGVHGGGVYGRGVHGRGALMAGGMHGRWVCIARGCAWQGACMAGACMAERHVWQGGDYEIRSMSGQYASYWNAFLLQTIMMSKKNLTHFCFCIFK